MLGIFAIYYNFLLAREEILQILMLRKNTAIIDFKEKGWPLVFFSNNFRIPGHYMTRGGHFRVFHLKQRILVVFI